MMSALVGHVFRWKLSHGFHIENLMAPQVIAIAQNVLTHHLNTKLPMLSSEPEASSCEEDPESFLTRLVAGGVRGYPSANW